MLIRPIQQEDEVALVRLIADFRSALSGLRGHAKPPDTSAAEQELAEYLEDPYPIFVAEADDELVGYIVCRVDKDVVWAESLFVKPAFRRQGIAGLLYAEAELLAEQLGGEAPYNWIDPNNTAIIRFLAGRGYAVLNLLEVRRPYQGEQLHSKIHVGRHVFKCSDADSPADSGG